MSVDQPAAPVVVTFREIDKVLTAPNVRFTASTTTRWISRLTFLIFAVAIFSCESVRAQDVSELYTISELQAIGDRYRPRLRGLWQEDFLSKLSRDERAQPVTLDIPLIGENGYILDFYSDPDRRQVVLPVASIKFLDDMAVAFAYYEKIVAMLAS